MTGRDVAVVLGASATGSMAAAALARAYRRVVVVERDALATDGPLEARKGVAQGRHNHNLTPRVAHTLERLAPGVCDELRARGATVCDMGDGLWYVAGEKLARTHVGQPQILASRPLLDRTLLARLAALPNVELRDRTDACGLTVEGDRVSGVRLIGRREGREETLAADLVVDASGRGSRTPKWLAELGRAVPEEESMDVAVRYTTRSFRRDAGDLDGARFVYVTGVAPGRPRGCVAFAVDGDRWMVLLFSYGAPTPTAIDDFRAFVAALGAPELAALVARAEPIGEPATYAFPRSTRRRYDRCSLPAGLLVLGDALQSTNPAWGLGITSAALQVEVLEARLARPGEPTRGFHAAALRACFEVWGPVLDRDATYDVVAGRPSLPGRVIPALLGPVFVAARTQPALARAVLEVIGHVRSPLWLLRPDRLLSAWLARDAARAALPEAARTS
ncbi:MAG: FAD-dependent monooxygenase [Sandaracinaceae bacterium]|nr:FAD-dependent monooxygenase [Sandaracinaceae bacterium]